MLVYILKRILYFIPTFFIISLFTFMLSQMAPGDPVELKLTGGMQSSNGQAAEKLAGEKAYMELSEKLGRDIPSFYFSITSKAYPDTLYRVPRKSERENLSRMIDMYCNWPKIEAYYHSAKALEDAVVTLPTDTVDPDYFSRTRQIREACNNLYTNYDDAYITIVLDNIKKQVYKTIDTTVNGEKLAYNELAPVKAKTDALLNNYASMKNQATRALKYQPNFIWYGLHNQYHRWLFGDVPWFKENTDPTKTSRGFFRGDFGESYLDSRPVKSILFDALKWTLLLNLITFIIIYVQGIPIGVNLAIKKGSFYDRAVTVFLFIAYSVPTFWMGIVLITFFTSDYYAGWMNIFPPYGLGKIGPDYGVWEKVIDRGYHFILPVFCTVFGASAYISRQMRGGMLTILRQDYIRTAFAKGLAPRTVYWKHAFRNSLIPIITMFASFLPAMISGAVIIEYLFTIPGMGRISYESVVARNFPVLFTILMFSAILTMLGNLLSDILYGVVDPRISFTKKQG